MHRGCSQTGLEAAEKLPKHLLEVPSQHQVPLSGGRHELPDFSRPGSTAGLPLMKDRALLQARPCCLASNPAEPINVGLRFKDVGS
jgi:hypothetical protein